MKGMNIGTCLSLTVHSFLVVFLLFLHFVLLNLIMFTKVIVVVLMCLPVVTG